MLKKFLTISIIILSTFSSSFSQAPKETAREQSNLISNASFEEYLNRPVGWFYKGKHYNKVMKRWSAATMASPDVYGPGVRIPVFWASQGFGNLHPRTGNCMSGITLYGCDDGKPHCREYIQTRLEEALVPEQRYEVEVWCAALEKSKLVNNLGIYFSQIRTSVVTDRELDLKPLLNHDEVIQSPNSEWVKVSFEFTAEEPSWYMILGNFFPDSLTTAQGGADRKKYAYYYIDDVSLKKLEPIIEQKISEDDLSRIVLEAGKSVKLKDIFFDTDKSVLLPASYNELNKLVQILLENPSTTIEIGGHTDNIGQSTYNIKLSRARAKAVVDYLTYHGIDYQRLSYKGYGDTRPIATNDTKEGRQLNRRVEFTVLNL